MSPISHGDRPAAICSLSHHPVLCLWRALSLSFSAVIFSMLREAKAHEIGACVPLQDEPHMRQWKRFCMYMHIRKGKAGHSVGITRDSLTKQQKCNMEPDFAQFTGSTATRRALAACQNSKASWSASGRGGFAACAARSSCLHQLQARRTCAAGRAAGAAGTGGG